jgi:RNA polymerase sigma factor (sigma-70 family)
VTDDIPATEDLDDAKLLNLVRAEDAAAFAALYQRHEQAARRLAREMVVSPAEVEYVVAETFGRVLDVTRRGGGPTDAFRPYLLTGVRRVSEERLAGQRRQIPTIERDAADHDEPFFATAAATPNRSLIARAFVSLPERWIAVLWHTEVERAGAAEVAPIFGLTRSGVAALRQRAKEALRQAYLQMYISGVTRAECKPVAQRLGAFVGDALSGRETIMVTGHLSECDECQAVCTELADVSAALRAVVAPIFLGSAATSYLASTVHNPAGAAAGTALVTMPVADAGGDPDAFASAGDGSLAGADAVGSAGRTSGGSIDGGGAGAAVAGASTGLMAAGDAPWDDASRDDAPDGKAGLLGISRLRRASLLTQWLAGGVAAVVAVFAVAFAVTLTGNKTPLGPAHPRPQAGATVSPASLTSSGQPQPKGSTSPSARRPSASASARQSSAAPTSWSASASPPPAVTPPPGTPTPTPSESASGSAQLAATANVAGGGYFKDFGQVFFQVTNTGSAATGELTVTITLPAGSSMIADGGRHGDAASDHHHDWSCQPTATGATCQHAAISAGAQIAGAIFITLSGTAACGQPVEVTATSGSASASAQSGGIPC